MMSASTICSWKEEPASPLFQLEDSWLDASDNVAVEVEITDEVKASRAEHATKLLRDLDRRVIEEEPFPDWLEEKIDLPIFEDLPPPPQLINNMDVMGMKPTAPSIGSSLDMLTLKPASINNCNLNIVTMKQSPSVNNNLAIETISVKPQPQTVIPAGVLQYQIPPPALPMDQTPVLMQELDYLGPPQHNTLTPPESPREADLVFTMLQEMQPHELDELVRMRVESLVESPADTSCSSLHEESESVASPSSESGYSDPEWTLPSCSSPDLTPKRRRVSKPYARAPPEEKRLRKKEQNKNAATRYRLKKKQEIEEILGEEKELQQKNEGLRSDLVEVRREIKYLKNLMRDMFRAKGLIK